MVEKVVFVAICVAGIGFLVCVFAGLCREGTTHRSLLGRRIRSSRVVVALGHDPTPLLAAISEQPNTIIAESCYHDGITGHQRGWQVVVNPRRLRA